jgi:hypothetical protein
MFSLRVGFAFSGVDWFFGLLRDTRLTAGVFLYLRTKMEVNYEWVGICKEEIVACIRKRKVFS